MVILRAIAHVLRFRVLQRIAKAGEVTCGDIGKQFPVSQPTMSHHLKILSDAGLIRVRRVGQHGLLSVDRKLLAQLSKLIPQRIPKGSMTRPSRRASNRRTHVRKHKGRGSASGSQGERTGGITDLTS